MRPGPGENYKHEHIRIRPAPDDVAPSRFARVFRRMTGGKTIAISSAWVTLVAVADRRTGIEPVFTLLYVFPIAMATWYLGRKAGYFASSICALCGLFVDYLAWPAPLRGWLITWNICAQFGVFLVIATLVNVVRETINREARERRLAVDQLRHADRLNTIGKLAAGIAHELGTPIHVVLGHAALIANDRARGDEAKVSARTIIDQADRMTTIIRQLLDFGRRSGKGRREAELIDIANETAALLAKLASDRNVRIDVAPTEMDATVFVNVSEIQQVISNLILNAIQSMPHGGQILVRSGSEDHPFLEKEVVCAWLSIEDEGAGIATEDISRIFDPFFTTKPVGDGVGLGLSVSYGIVADHAGWFTVDSELGEGSRFVVHLPTRVTRLDDESV